MKKIFIIFCNPRKGSFSQALAEAYQHGAREANDEVRSANAYDLDIDFFNVNDGRADSVLHPALKEVQNNILWADRLVFIYPVWWLSIPAKLKALVEKIFQEDVVAKYTSSGNIAPLLTGKTAVVVQTYDMPVFYMKHLCSDAPFKLMKKGILGFTGIKVVGRFDFGMMLKSTVERRAGYLKQVEHFARRQ